MLTENITDTDILICNTKNMVIYEESVSINDDKDKKN